MTEKIQTTKVEVSPSIMALEKSAARWKVITSQELNQAEKNRIGGDDGVAEIQTAWNLQSHEKGGLKTAEETLALGGAAEIDRLQKMWGFQKEATKLTDKFNSAMEGLSNRQRAMFKVTSGYEFSDLTEDEQKSLNNKPEKVETIRSIWEKQQKGQGHTMTAEELLGIGGSANVQSLVEAKEKFSGNYREKLGKLVEKHQLTDDELKIIRGEVKVADDNVEKTEKAAMVGDVIENASDIDKPDEKIFFSADNDLIPQMSEETETVEADQKKAAETVDKKGDGQPKSEKIIFNANSAYFTRYDQLANKGEKITDEEREELRNLRGLFDTNPQNWRNFAEWKKSLKQAKQAFVGQNSAKANSVVIEEEPEVVIAPSPVIITDEPEVVVKDDKPEVVIKPEDEVIVVTTEPTKSGIIRSGDEDDSHYTDEDNTTMPELPKAATTTSPAPTPTPISSPIAAPEQVVATGKKENILTKVQNGFKRLFGGGLKHAADIDQEMLVLQDRMTRKEEGLNNSDPITEAYFVQQMARLKEQKARLNK